MGPVLVLLVSCKILAGKGQSSFVSTGILPIICCVIPGSLRYTALTLCGFILTLTHLVFSSTLQLVTNMEACFTQCSSIPPGYVLYWVIPIRFGLGKPNAPFLQKSLVLLIFAFLYF
ncbi:hypothetical protein HN51_000698 [Arachis hypogaea]